MDSPVLSKSVNLAKSERKDDSPAEALRHRKTKIVCTLGPSSNTVEMIANLLKAGMNVARFNFSHGTHETHQKVVDNVRTASKLTGIACALMLDTKGPEIRTGLVKAPVKLKANQEIDVVTAVPDDFLGDETRISMDYAALPKVVKPGSVIKIADGVIVAHVVSTHPEEKPPRVRVRMQNDATLTNRKGVNVPGGRTLLPDVTEKDKEDFKFAIKNDFDFIAASFVRRPEAVREIRRLLGEEGKGIHIISKIENQEGLDNFDEILDESDAIMVARGDLGVEIAIQKVVTAQKMMIRKCNIAGKPVITATQMLESMSTNPRPTRAEAGDVANAVFDGTDCVMLSGETASGEYPVEVVETMGRICKTAEQAIDYSVVFDTIVHLTRQKYKQITRAEAITSSAVKISLDLPVGAIISLTESGSSSRLIAKYKPAVPVITLTPSERVARQCLMSRSLVPLVVPGDLSEDESRRIGTEYAIKMGWAQPSDEIVVVAGVVMGRMGSTNTVKVYPVE